MPNKLHGIEPAGPFDRADAVRKLPERGYPLSDVLAVLNEIAANDFMKWFWGRNWRCKYVTLAIDTRDGGYVRLTDRDGSPITLDDFARQIRAES